MSQFCGVRDIHIVTVTQLHNLFILPNWNYKTIKQ